MALAAVETARAAGPCYLSQTAWPAGSDLSHVAVELMQIGGVCLLQQAAVVYLLHQLQEGAPLPDPVHAQLHHLADPSLLVRRRPISCVLRFHPDPQGGTLCLLRHEPQMVHEEARSGRTCLLSICGPVI
eukprot:CAMPEP_0202915442 /NCGR_PEP_ID=MMETSP1392-20130828/65672_1 /ASSEMBLY_ACC=CAM_ASM_000868 /TAXON_ID=225041 /ORGANISM="Chlamydomonas chlamydogama, Strain SAG 11-48b" /LENGTH=129 /DNA_ID=CAMNT_0049607467 /DNA_START=323 /DNA_END=713 /DNA_ORIENTATION=+